MNPIANQQPIKVTFENQQDIVNFVAKPIMAPNAKKFNAAMAAMRDPGGEVVYHPIFGNDVVYRVDQAVIMNPDAIEGVLRQVYACRKRNQMIVGGALVAGAVVAGIIIKHDDSKKDKE